MLNGGNRGTVTVVKLGGGALRNRGALHPFAERLCGLQGDRVVVHGGGDEISRWQERVGIPARWREGLRVTTPEGMQVTAMVLSGWINKRIVSTLVDVGIDAVGLSGEDGSLLRTERRAPELGEVGRVVEVSPRPLRALLAAGFVPVVSPVSRGPCGVPLNVNADEAASALAVALGADRLLLLSDVPGVVVDGAVVPEIDPLRVAREAHRGTVSGGMGVKLGEAVEAARAGVEVRVGDLELLGDPWAGTRVVPVGAGAGRTRRVAVSA